jgi:hypothetical protein
LTATIREIRVTRIPEAKGYRVSPSTLFSDYDRAVFYEHIS